MTKALLVVLIHDIQLLSHIFSSQWPAAVNSYMPPLHLPQTASNRWLSSRQCASCAQTHTPRQLRSLTKAEGPPLGPLRGRCVHQGTTHTAAICSGKLPALLHPLTHTDLSVRLGETKTNGDFFFLNFNLSLPIPYAAVLEVDFRGELRLMSICELLRRHDVTSSSAVCWIALCVLWSVRTKHK